jgi:tetratricopeptide (TPR) repeat protein
MKSLLAIACLIVILFPPLVAQKRSRGGASVRQPGPSQDMGSGALFLSGKVVLSDGTSLTEAVTIQSVCQGQNRNETRTDAHGNFSFQFGNRISSAVAGIGADASNGMRTISGSRATNANGCELQASLAGFSSESILLDGRVNGSENVDLGRIVLHRVASVDGLTISATTAAAPATARKAFSKGQREQKKGHWEEAQKLFEKAVGLYPKFAAAWFELGSVQRQENNFAAARQSFQRSIMADEKYINPYRGLMQLALHNLSWNEAVDASDKLLALNPVNFPDAWLGNGIGHYYLDNFAAAEKSARRGIAIDSLHHFPMLEYLLGMALMKTNAYPEATRHLEAYRRLTTSPTDIAEAQKQLAEVARLSAAQSHTVSENK